jgi:hypothetical protein
MLDLLAAEHGWALEPATLTVPSGARVEVDGATADRTVLVECWAHQGKPKSAQRHKVLADAFKLAWIATTMRCPQSSAARVAASKVSGRQPGRYERRGPSTGTESWSAGRCGRSQANGGDQRDQRPLRYGAVRTRCPPDADATMS